MRFSAKRFALAALSVYYNYTEIVKTLSFDLKVNFILKRILCVSKYFILNTPYLIMRSMILGFAIYRSKVNTSLKNNIFFFLKKMFSLQRWCSETFKNIQIKFR